jgi:hypothetical protein
MVQQTHDHDNARTDMPADMHRLVTSSGTQAHKCRALQGHNTGGVKFGCSNPK